MRSLPTLPLLVLAVGLSAGSALRAQRVRIEAPLGAVAPPPGAVQGSDDDPGVAVEMFENPNLDRYLRRAQSFLERQEFQQAIRVLQDVIEGRTVEVANDADGGAPDQAATADPAPPPAPPPATARPDRRGPANAGGAGSPAGDESPRGRTTDARQAVFAANGRLFRPVRRLCHELLARLPAAGIEIYRTNYEVAAEELLQQAERDGSVAALEQVGNRYFVTLAAGRAMALLADRLMHEGRYRAAVQVLRDLTEVYPADNQKRVGLSSLWCRFKLALCLRFAGEADAAHAVAVELAASHGDASLRLLGELQAVAELPTGKLFARDYVAVAPTPASASWLDADTFDLIPLWQYRFRNQEPFRDPKGKQTETFRHPFGDGGVVPSTMPFAARYAASGWVTFTDGTDSSAGNAPQALFLEHYRLRAVDAATGVLLAEGKGPDEPPTPRDNHPRVRNAASDQALLRPVDDGQRRYVLLGHGRATSGSIDVLKASTLVAVSRNLEREEWSSAQWSTGDLGLRDVTFLAAPTVFGERLMLPAMRRSAYSLECLDRRTGKPLWNTPLHAGGSAFFKAPGCPVVVQSGIAFVLTNAGCVAAVDAFTGDLRWIRRYERIDARRRPTKSKRPSRDDMDFGAQFGFAELPSFYPSDMSVRAGLVLLAPVDGDVLLSLDSASGEPAWWVDGGSRYLTAAVGRLRGLIGANDQRAFVQTDTHVVAIGLAGGLIEWAIELPQWNGTGHKFRGRGAVVGDDVVVPGQREILVLAGDGKQMRRLPLPAFDSSREPLRGPLSLSVHGPWLAVGYPGGIELFSTSRALRQLAEAAAAPQQKAMFLVQAGDAAAAVANLCAAIPLAKEPAVAAALGDQLLGLVREHATTLARAGDLDGGLATLDAIVNLLTAREQRLRWHLARVEICKEVADLPALDREQQRLYRIMEGKASDGGATELERKG
jgi:outer membrane protein assembly factor BamB/tetratricopeptide (TPR) repeat protein